MATVDIEIDTNEVAVNPSSGRSVILNFRAEKSAVLGHFDVQEILQHFDRGDLLDAIGEAAAREHFGIEDADE